MPNIKDATIERVSAYGFQIKGSADWYNWDKEYTTHPKANKGDVACIEYTENESNGKTYRNVTTYALTSGAPPVEQKNSYCPPAKGEFRTPDQIMRQEVMKSEALRLAVENFDLSSSVKIDNQLILNLAEEQYQWVKNGSVQNEDKAE